MRFGKSIEYYKDKKHKEVFAWLPITVNGQTRWLEKVKIKGYYYVGLLSGKIRFMEQGYLDD